MFRVKKFLSLAILVIGVVVVAFLPTRFSFAQNYGLLNNNLLDMIFRFTMPNNHVYLYAITEPNTYTINFDGNGNTSGNMDGMSMIYDKKANLLANNFTKDGYFFKGWSSSKTGTVEYLDQENVWNLTAVDAGVVTLYAQRESEIPYIIEYYQENEIGTGYYLVETGVMYGRIGTGIVLTGKIYTGFTLQTGNEFNIISGGVVPYYYTRNLYNAILVDRNNILTITGIKYGTDIPLPQNPEWTGNTFLGWDNLPLDGKMPANNIVLTSTWSYGLHTITFDTNGGTEISPITMNYGLTIDIPENPKKDGYEFVGWSPEIPTTMPYDDITIVAIWKEINKGGGGGGGGNIGGNSHKEPDIYEGEIQHGTTEEGNNYQIGEKFAKKPDFEVLMAYIWAYRKGIIGTSWVDSDPDGYISRGDMAEMVVKFTENVLGRKVPPIPVRCKWGDVENEWKSSETKAYAEKACALGVMGIRMVKFMPNKILDRAEFGTILSRLLWGDKYDVINATNKNPYYTRHLDALNREGIMKQIENPESRKELRKRAWLMMMRVK